MACRGVYYAIQNDVVEKLLASNSDEEVLEVLFDDIEEEWDREWLHETDKAWDAIHRCLTNGRLQIDGSWNPLGAAVLGGRQLHKGNAWIISFVQPEQVNEVATALSRINELELKARYDQIDASDYDGEIGAEDWEYTWSYFQGIPDLFRRAAASGRGIVFSADQ